MATSGFKHKAIWNIQQKVALWLFCLLLQFMCHMVGAFIFMVIPHRYAIIVPFRMGMPYHLCETSTMTTTIWYTYDAHTSMPLIEEDDISASPPPS
eukprot:15367216-Ditylum_brightwellii.AAC.1